MAHVSRFIDSPRLGNQYLEDSALQSVLSSIVPDEYLKEWNSELTRFGQRVLGDVLEWGRESERNPPRLIQYSAWGERIDRIEVSQGWKNLLRLAAEEGLIAHGYERKFGEFSRIFQFCKLYLFHPSSAVADCPLAMTDGATRCLELNRDHWTGADQVLSHLLSRDPASFWTSGQWMTEKNGGSDISNSETIAKPTNKSGEYELTGYKFFTSAITSDVALTLARVVDTKGETVSGSRGLSCFFIRTHNDNGKLNNIIVHKLKDKLGTKAVPTAELELKGSIATLLGPVHRGVPVISTMLNITRTHNAICSVAVMRRAIAVARDYASRRKVFSKLLSDNNLHLSTLAALEIEFRANLLFCFDVVLLLGKSETGKASPEQEVLLRLLTPILKLYTAKHAISIVSECIECLGGTGYMEDSDLPRLLRDAQGTTNVLSHDIWRPIKSQNAFEIYVDTVQQRLTQAKSSPHDSIRISALYVEENLKALERFSHTAFVVDSDLGHAISRPIAFALARIYTASLMLQHSNRDSREIEITRRYTMEQPLAAGLVSAHQPYRELTRSIAMDIDSKSGLPRGVGDFFNGIPRSKY